VNLTESEKEHLLNIAKTAVKTRLAGNDTREKKTPDMLVLKEKRGAFVTLKKRGQLRGCIGYIQAVKPLGQTIDEMAQAAAFSDPRFPSVTEEELPFLSFEISVLTPLKEIENVDEIEVGVHGIYIVKGFHSGLLLPQVATEYGWDRKTFLEHTCYKAGLSPRAWQDKDAKIYIFSADIFCDSE
jgi:AmmeMemoRadiSam system protein A